MLKYQETEITFAEIPDEITLCVNISNCPCHCKGCHSPHLWKDEGTPLDLKALYDMITPHKTGITCICLMGGDAEPEEVNFLALLIRETFANLRIAWYSGRQELSDKINVERFNYIKLGPYIEEYGPLNKPSTNQRLYKVTGSQLIDITSRFWNINK